MRHEDDGQGLAAYALTIGVLAVAVIVAMVVLQAQLHNLLTNIGRSLT